MNVPLRIAILTHSTNPRGGVVHALELGDALHRLGHDVTVHAPDPGGAGFFRAAQCRTIAIPADAAGHDVTAMVEKRSEEYLRYFAPAERRRFDVWHAQDGISGNALAAMKERGLIHGFARTVHHVDDFPDPRLAALQWRGIGAADTLFTVSRLWQDWLAHRLDRQAILVGNGVDRERFAPRVREAAEALRARLGVPAGAHVFLAIGGVEERKNTIGILQAFTRIHAAHRAACLVIAGGASILDHGAYQRDFAAALAGSGLPHTAVIRTGPLPQALMPALYRAADTLAFPSIREGFGLVVLEAMASGVPVIVSRIAPFTEYLGAEDALWCDPLDPAAIARAMAASFAAPRRAALIARGLRLAARHSWEAVATRHLAPYGALREPSHA